MTVVPCDELAFIACESVTYIRTPTFLVISTKSTDHAESDNKRFALSRLIGVSVLSLLSGHRTIRRTTFDPVRIKRALLDQS